LGPLDVRTSEGSGVADPARRAPATGTAAPAVAANPAGGPAEFTVAVLARDIANGGETEGAPSETLPPLESATAQTQAAAGSRETGVSQLSRATIEATAQIAAQIQRRLEGRSTRFEMALTPDELGRVDVKLDIDSEGRLNARLAFDNPAAATDLRGRADELRRQLEEAGFHLAEDAFEFAERDSGSSAFDRGQDARNGSSRFAAASRLNAEIDVAQPPRWMALTLSPSGLDMKV
ncbi:MAG: flagellar hook-length control protein FliK, partial [Pseudomonadota bacterium]|nr:flagellar hook-length control protein FliK [Pseudomonadota bacterium]